MSNKGLYFYKLVSKYPEDQTVNCKLSINQIDSNFEVLKDADIKSAEFIKEEKVLVLTRNDGEKFVVSLGDVTYSLNASVDTSDNGTDLTISYNDGIEDKEITIENIITYDYLSENFDSFLDKSVFKKVITDATLRGNGTLDKPLGLNGVYKTGMVAPSKAVIDLTNGERLPEVAKLGARYITKEYVNDYGYLYNGSAIEKIADNLDAIGSGWRVPTKADWDALLNSLEPCEYQNHNSERCHVELGLNAGYFLKSDCGWHGQDDCKCMQDESGCTSNEALLGDETHIGVDKYGMRILPAGSGIVDSLGRIITQGFKEEAHFWTTTNINEDPTQDSYVKGFVWNESGVEQSAECPKSYFSIRLVKDYDGSNYFDNEYIDGIVYKTVLFPNSKQVWLGENYAKKDGFVNDEENEVPEVIDVNNGHVLEKRIVFFINEWNGDYWEKRALSEGETLSIELPCFSGESTTEEYCWIDNYGERHCLDIEIPFTEQRNLEFRVYTDEDCNEYLINTDDLVTERVLNALMPILIKEIVERKAADEALNEAIESEKEARLSGESELWSAIVQEASARTNADIMLDGKIADERDRAIEAEAQLDSKIEDEVSRATNSEEVIDGQLIDWRIGYLFNAAGELDGNNLVLKSKDNNPEHFIKIDFNASFGEI